MSELTLFVIGTIVFAITVYGSVMAGGLLLMKEAASEGALPPEVGDDVDLKLPGSS